jgi:predicted nuclease of predicted toxin-antitoxin system
VEAQRVAVKLKLDENLSRHLKPVLLLLGHDTETADDEGMLSRPDTEVGRAAREAGRILLTLDLEFGDLRKYPPGGHPGIVLFRPRDFGPLSVNRFVERFVRDTNLEELAGCLAIVEPFRVRIRRPPINFEEEGWKEIPL